MQINRSVLVPMRDLTTEGKVFFFHPVGTSFVEDHAGLWFLDPHPCPIRHHQRSVIMMCWTPSRMVGWLFSYRLGSNMMSTEAVATAVLSSEEERLESVLNRRLGSRIRDLRGHCVADRPDPARPHPHLPRQAVSPSTPPWKSPKGRSWRMRLRSSRTQFHPANIRIWGASPEWTCPPVFFLLLPLALANRMNDTQLVTRLLCVDSSSKTSQVREPANWFRFRLDVGIKTYCIPRDSGRIAWMCEIQLPQGL